MDQNLLHTQIADLEREIALLPEGSITKKKIKGKEYYYLRITRNGKRTESYIPFEKEPLLRAGIEKRKSLERQLKRLETYAAAERHSDKNSDKKVSRPGYRTIVRTGRELQAQISVTRQFRKRECISLLRDYIFGPANDKVFILYGLRRTGKTTMIRQILTELSEDEFSKAAFIQVRPQDDLADVDADLRLLEQNGFCYIFIDEVTLMEDFIEGAALFSDIYASSGMKIVLSGTDSLGFAFSKEEQLYDRCIMLHTTFIPYREFENVLGIKGIDEYIRYGGTMSLSGINYNADTSVSNAGIWDHNIETPFTNSKTAEEYIDTAIARNIQHALKLYEYGGHFRALLDLYEKGELTNVINRVVENINHSFTRNVIEQTFRSHDISVTAANLLRDRENPINLKDHLNVEIITEGIRQTLDILNKEEQTVEIEDAHLQQIREYLTLLDIIMEIDLVSMPEVSKKNGMTVITQPGLRYAQANAIVENILMDTRFNELSARERKHILDRLQSEIRGRMMEEIILLETRIARPDKKVFKLQFTIGEYDMVIYDPAAITCQIYEIKYSTTRVPNQYRHLINPQKTAMTTHRYGDITGRYVIYRGETATEGDITYLNVEEYLKSL